MPAIVACQRAVEQHLDLDAILAIARRAPTLPITPQRAATSWDASPITQHATRSTYHASRPAQYAVRIAIFRDRAFTFYYPENLEALAAAGAELAPLDALQNTTLPDVDALFIGGGFPEMFMAELSANASLRQAVREAAEAGLPIYAECGGLMYLSRRIIWGERMAEMAGVLPCDVEMTGRPQGHGYIEAEVDGANPFFPAGTTLRGHEFHNSRLVHLLHTAYCVGEGVATAYCLRRGSGMGNGRDGLVYRNVLASYTHLHAAGAPTWAEALVRRGREFRRDKMA